MFVDPSGAQLRPSGGMQKGPDGNYHVGWLNEVFWNNIGFYDWGNEGMGSGNYSTIGGIGSSDVLSQMNFGDRFGKNKTTGAYGFWSNYIFDSGVKGDNSGGLYGVGVGARWEALGYLNSQSIMNNLSQIGLGSIKDGFDYAQYTEMGVGVTQLSMIAYRQSLPLMSTIGTFPSFFTTYSKLSIARNFLGKVGNIGAVFEVGMNYNQATLPVGNPNKISWGRFGYRTTGTLTSIVGSTVIGTEFGGPWGAVAGGMIGLSFAAGEQVYDGYNYSVNEISTGVANYENAINRGWMPRW